jgi:UDP-glucose 4-epimerase
MKNLYLCGSGFLANAFIENRDMFKGNEILIRQLSRDFTYAHLYAKLESTVLELLENDMDLIINLSGPTNIQDSFMNPSLYLEGPLQQVKAHMKILEKFRNKITYIYLSSASVYGNVQNRVSESSPVNPESPYAQGKYNVESFSYRVIWFLQMFQWLSYVQHQYMMKIFHREFFIC